ncbi:MAG: hypothetical protein IH934_06715 [Nanoarchaeota archaeon]|nr:hypothetical protein [Nanoarchaeota archaeon]
MTRKIKLSHTEVDVKLFLEVLAVYGILALVLVGVYYLEPVITGFVTVTKQINYTDEVNLEFDEISTYIWDLGNPGPLKSIKISGSKIKQGEAKVYIEDNGVRYLIFDSSQLVEKPSGIFGITGFAVSDEDGEENNKNKNKEPNHPPVWNSSIESFIVNESLTVNLNDYFNDKDGDILNYSFDEIVDLEILLDNEILIINNKNKIEGNRTLHLTATDNDVSKKKGVVLILTREIIINETLEKIININLDYGDNEIYDANNDGVESLKGIIDFTVENSLFNWPVDESKLCTRYEIFSIENEESTFACFGNNNCCNFVDLQSSRASWNESLFLSYGGYGSTNNNIIFAQILHVDYNLSLDNPFIDIAYSPWDNLTSSFVTDILEFENVCIDTCLFSGNASSYKLIIELENTTLNIDEIKYSIEEKTTNNDPILTKQIVDISILENEEYILDLTEYFSDEDNDDLNYDYYKIDNVSVRFEDNFAYIIPDEDFVGSRFTFITANDSFSQVATNVFKIEIKKPEKLSIELSNFEIDKGNWIVSFETTGTGNLTISAVDGSYSEIYNDNISTINDLDILELRCGEFEIFDKDNLVGNENLWFVLMNNSKVKLIDLVQLSAPVKSLYVENYNCNNEMGHYTVRVLTKGEKTQKFNFSNEIKIVGIENIERVLSEFFEIRGDEGGKLAVFDSFGNVKIKGNLTRNILADENDFVIRNASNGINLVVTNPEGNLQIKGSLNENESSLSPSPRSFVIKNKNGDVIAYVNSGGSLFLTGTLTESVSFE